MTGWQWLLTGLAWGWGGPEMAKDLVRWLKTKHRTRVSPNA